VTVTYARPARVKIIAVLTTVLILAGAGGAAAYWTASATLAGSATGASIGITQTDPLELATTYNAGNLLAADSVTLENTGEREAALRVTVDATGSNALKNALTVRIATVDSAESCTPSANLPNVPSGKLGLTYAPTPELPAGESTTLCIQTVLPPEDLFRAPSSQTQLSVTSVLDYATGDAWKASSVSENLQQNIAANPANGGPSASCSGSYYLSAWDTLTFAFGSSFSTDATEFQAFVERGGRVLPVPVAAITPDRGNRTVTITEESLRDVDVSAGDAQFIVKQKRGTGPWTIAGVGKINYSGLWGSLRPVSCR
jgi:hypothetical protein